MVLIFLKFVFYLVQIWLHTKYPQSSSLEILSSFSSRLRKLFQKPSGAVASKALKVIYHDFPGGAETFELFTRFCYNNGRTQITPNNTCLLHCVAHFMDMTDAVSSSENLIMLTEKSLEGIAYWTWPETVIALKQCQDFLSIAKSSGVLDKILDSLLGRISTTGDASPTGSSPESSAFRFSCDTRSTISTKFSNCRSWWYEDLVVLNSEMVENFIKSMVARKVDHAVISRFLFYYFKCRFASATTQEKKKVTEITINLLDCLDRTSISCKGLFGILRISSSLKLSKDCRDKLETMIGSQIDQATLDNLLVPAAKAVDSLYDVNLILRFLKSFLNNGGRESLTRLKRVGSLMDLYLAEVAPDSCLKLAKFVALTTSLPDVARDCHDAIYRAIDMYLEVHACLSDEEKTKICCAINYEKLSSECCKHLAKNSRFPSKTAIQALISQHSKLKNLLQDTNQLKPLEKALPKGKQHDDGEQVILYAKKLDLSMENEKLRAHLEGMQWKVMELEKICRKMQTQMTKMKKTQKSNPSVSKSLPRLCS